MPTLVDRVKATIATKSPGDARGATPSTNGLEPPVLYLPVRFESVVVHREMIPDVRSPLFVLLAGKPGTNMRPRL